MSTATHRPNRRPHTVVAPEKLGPFPTTAWTRLHNVQIPTDGGSAIPSAEVIVGPSGVHVVLTQGPIAGGSSRLLTREAQSAADWIAGALPPRYRNVVCPALLLADVSPDTDEADDLADSGVVAGVTVAVARVLSEAIRFKPRVLSHSESAVVHARLRAALEPTQEKLVRSGRWSWLSRRRRGLGWGHPRRPSGWE